MSISTNINVASLPTFVMDLSQMLHAHEIKTIMKKAKVKYYCYAFIYKNEVMKYGMSADKDHLRGSYGERVYRQSFHIPGWPSVPSATSAGADMRDVISKFPSVLKNDVCIKIWDMTNYSFQIANNPKLEVGDLERELLDLHEQATGSIPKGNVRDERLIPIKPRILDKHFDSLFDKE